MENEIKKSEPIIIKRKDKFGSGCPESFVGEIIKQDGKLYRVLGSKMVRSSDGYMRCYVEHITAIEISDEDAKPLIDKQNADHEKRLAEQSSINKLYGA